MNTDQIRQHVILTATERDRRQICHEFVLLSEMLADQGNSPEIVRAQVLIEQARDLALSAMRD